jgi:hypothetical protein
MYADLPLSVVVPACPLLKMKTNRFDHTSVQFTEGGHSAAARRRKREVVIGRVRMEESVRAGLRKEERERGGGHGWLEQAFSFKSHRL